MVSNIKLFGRKKGEPIVKYIFGPNSRNGSKMTGCAQGHVYVGDLVKE